MHTLELLKYIGYKDDGNGRYVYEQTSLQNEIAQRERALEEFQRFHCYLTSIKDGHSTNLQDLQSVSLFFGNCFPCQPLLVQILLSHSQSTFNDGCDVDHECEYSTKETE